MATLSRRSGAEFDRAFLDHETATPSIQAHLDLLRTTQKQIAAR